MKKWLIKFAPFRYSWEKCLLNNNFEIYGVRNAQARNNLKEMKSGDKVLFYHSQKELRILGEMEVLKEYHQDTTTINPNWVSVTFVPINSLEKPITLNEIKNNPKLQNTGLVKQPRLAVMELTEEEYGEIIKMSSEV